MARAKKETAIPGWVWPSLVAGLVLVAIGLFLSQDYGGLIVGLLDAVGLVLVLAGIIGLVLGLFGRRVDLWKVLLGVFVVLVAASMSVMLLSGDGGDEATEASEFGEPRVEGSLPSMPSSSPADATATGLATPTVIGGDFDGADVIIDEDGKAKAILFLAHWSPHCQNEVSRVQAWLNETGGVDGVDMYSVSTSISSARPNYPASEWLASEGWTIPVIRDDNDDTVVRSFGGGGYPYWVFANADGTVAMRTSGELAIVDLETIMRGLQQ